MAKYQSHISLSAFLAVLYGVSGLVIIDSSIDYALLAGIIVMIAGMLPNADAGKGAPPRELSGLIAALVPLILLESYPVLRTSGITRLTLFVICCYIITRMFVNRVLVKFTSPRGAAHSVPAAIIVFEIIYLFFWDAPWIERAYLGFAGFLGYFSHLFLDASSNLDILGKAVGNSAEKSSPTLKFYGGNSFATFLLYSLVLILGFFVLRDIAPGYLPTIKK